MTTKQQNALDAKVENIGENAQQLQSVNDRDGKLRQAGVDTSLDVVQLLRMIRDTAESALENAVPLAVTTGATWEQVGRHLGTSRQAAWERYRGQPAGRTE